MVFDIVSLVITVFGTAASLLAIFLYYNDKKRNKICNKIEKLASTIYYDGFPKQYDLQTYKRKILNSLWIELVLVNKFKKECLNFYCYNDESYFPRVKYKYNNGPLNIKVSTPIYNFPEKKKFKSDMKIENIFYSLDEIDSNWLLKDKTYFKTITLVWHLNDNKFKIQVGTTSMLFWNNIEEKQVLTLNGIDINNGPICQVARKMSASSFNISLSPSEMKYIKNKNKKFSHNKKQKVDLNVMLANKVLIKPYFLFYDNKIITNRLPIRFSFKKVVKHSSEQIKTTFVIYKPKSINVLRMAQHKIILKSAKKYNIEIETICKVEQ